MRHGRYLVIVLVAVSGSLLLGLSVHPARSSPAPAAVTSASPSASPSVEPSATPAPLYVVVWALRAQRRAAAGLREYKRAAACFGHGVRLHVGARPPRKASLAVWETAWQQWKRQARHLRLRVAKLVERMRSPGGQAVAAKWWPAALYEGWNPSLKSWFCMVVQRESTARPQAVNPSSGCYGLMQLAPMHWVEYGLAWIRDPLNQLWLAWKLYKGSGAAPWAL